MATLYKELTGEAIEVNDHMITTYRKEGGIKGFTDKEPVKKKEHNHKKG